MECVEYSTTTQLLFYESTLVHRQRITCEVLVTTLQSPM